MKRDPLSVASRLALVLALYLLQACSGGSGGGGSEREVNPSSSGSGSNGFVYEGPPPATDEIQSFKIAFYDPLADDNRCGECHTPGKTGTPAFVDQTNVNQAWQHARSLVNMNEPAASPVVIRLSAGSSGVSAKVAMTVAPD